MGIPAPGIDGRYDRPECDTFVLGPSLEIERTGAREYTRDAAHRYRDEALAELDAAGVVRPEARARLEQIIVSVISA